MKILNKVIFILILVVGLRATWAFADPLASRTGSRIQNKIKMALDVKVTAYDLSVQSCGKMPDHPAYGITCAGVNLKGKNWQTARVIAVDPKVIPLGSTVYIDFKDERYDQFNGYYLAADTGGAIKGKHIDFFLGDFNNIEAAQEAMNFGVTKAKVFVIQN